MYSSRLACTATIPAALPGPSAPREHPRQPGASAAQPAAPPLGLLLIGAAAPLCSTLTARLQADGLRFTLDCAPDSASAGAAIGRQMPDLLLVCLPLPATQARQFDQLLRASAPCLPVLALVNASDEHLARTAFAQGMAAYVLIEHHEHLTASVVQAVERARLFTRLGERERTILQLSRQVIHAQEQERTALAREMHDELGQRLSVLTMLLHRLEPHAWDAPQEAWPVLCQARSEVASLIAQVRGISRTLRPPALDNHGLERALEQMLASRLPENIRYRLEYVGPSQPMARELELSAYRVVQESVTNILRHANASNVIVEVNGGALGKELEIVVRDDGVGFDAQEQAALAGDASSGLSGMRARVHLLGGEFGVTSSADRGTCIRALIPLHSTQRSA